MWCRGGAIDLWTNKYTSEHIMAFTLSFIDSNFTLKVYNLLTVLFQGDETAHNIHRTLIDELWLKYKIPEIDVKKTKMVTDGGENVVKAVEDFEEWLYCMAHALNVCVRGALELKYHVVLGKCFKIHSVATILETCEFIVHFIKDDKSKDSAKLRKVLKRPKQHNSRVGMLLSFRAHLNEVQQFLHLSGKGEMLVNFQLHILDELIEFLLPLDFDGKREKSAEVTHARLPHLLQHCHENGNDSPITGALKKTVRRELEIMALVEQVDKCKKVVVFFKTSGCMNRLPQSLKQEIEVRWNSILNLLESIEKNWDQVTAVLEDLGKADKMDGISRDLIKLLIQFYRPFKEESLKLEGEKYPTLPLAQLAYHRLKSHCQQPLRCDDGEEEPLSFTLMRMRASKLLESKVRISVTHSIGTVLFPPYRKLQRLPDAEREEVYHEIRRLIAEDEHPTMPNPDLPPSPKRTRLEESYDGWTEEDSISVEDDLTRYLNNAIGAIRLENLLQWWKNEGAAYPKMQKLAISHLGILATSAPDERTFSGAGFILDARSIQMCSKTVDSTLFLNSYYRQHNNLKK